MPQTFVVVKNGLSLKSNTIIGYHLITDKEEQQCRQLMAGLDKVINDLDKQEKAINAQVRPPLEQTRPLQDSADRLQEIKVSLIIFQKDFVAVF